MHLLGQLLHRPSCRLFRPSQYFRCPGTRPQRLGDLIGVAGGLRNDPANIRRLIQVGGNLYAGLRRLATPHHQPYARHRRQDRRPHIRRQRHPVPGIAGVPIDLVVEELANIQASKSNHSSRSSSEESRRNTIIP